MNYKERLNTKRRTWQIIKGIYVKQFRHFAAFIDQGCLKINAGAGTGYKKDVRQQDDIPHMLDPIKNSKEKEIISFCENEGFEYWNYYEDRHLFLDNLK